MTKKQRERIKKLALFLTAVLIFVIFLFPIYWMIVCSVQQASKLYVMPPEWLPFNPTLENYKALFSDGYFLNYYKNSLIVSGGATLLTMITTVFCGYAFSRFRYRVTGFLVTAMLTTSMFPVVSQLISIYSTFKQFDLLNTHRGLMLVTTSVAMPFCVLMLKGFFDDVPIVLEEAARIDGCSRIGILFRVTFPLVKPGILAVGIYTFMRAWDDYQYALTLITKDELRTLGPGISIRYMGEIQYDWGKTLAVAVAASLPILIIFAFLQKYMVSGLTSGAVKG